MTRTSDLGQAIMDLARAVRVATIKRRRTKTRLRRRSYHMRKRGRIIQRREWRRY